MKPTKFQCKIHKHYDVVGFSIGIMHIEIEIPETYFMLQFLWWQIVIGKLTNKEYFE